MKSLRKTRLLAGTLFAVYVLGGLFATQVAGQTPPANPPSTPRPDGAEGGASSAPGGATAGGSPATPQTSGSQAPASQSPATPPQQQKPAARIVVPSSLVVVPVTVKDGNGRLIPDLRREEFRVFEDNVEQRISSFSAEAFPLSMVVLIDNDLKAKDAEQVQASIKAVVAGMSTADEASICRFDQFFHEGKGFTANQDRLLTELQRTPIDESRPTTAPPGGPFNGPTINGQAAPGVNQPDQYPSTRVIHEQHTKTLDDAVYGAAQLLEDRGRDRRKIILLISDGQNGAKFNSNPYANVVKELLRNNISVFSVAVGSAYFDRKFNRLVEYTHATGGDIYYALKRGTMEELYSRIAEEARHEYTLYYTPERTDRAADYHTIEVRVEREGLNVTAREGYYASGLQK
jgi:Ca-activated chloride channel family protein